MKNGWNVTTDPATGIMKFSFLSGDGQPVARFSANPSDVRLAQRMEKVAESFAAMTDQTSAEEYDAFLENKICEILGENQRKDLFSNMSATTVLPGGGLFAMEIIRQLHSSVIPELKKRREKVADAIRKHTAKYQ